MGLTPYNGRSEDFFFDGKFNGYFSKWKLANFYVAAMKSRNEQEDK